MENKNYFYPPMNISLREPKRKSIFIGGTIDMGNSENWQENISKILITYGFSVFNPRRPDWDNSINNDIEDPNFYQQVNWELNALEKSDYIIINFLSNSNSPISLAEFGLYAKSNKLFVVCGKNFYKRGNIEIMCDRYDVPIYYELNECVKSIIKDKS